MNPSTSAVDSARAFLNSRIDYERTSNIPYGERDFRLDRMRELLDRLGNPHTGLSIVHVAGTKGKGSTAATISAILRAAGFRTGLYSSPHLERVEERLRIDGEPCSYDELASLVEHVRPAVEQMDALPQQEFDSQRPTYFEILTAMAFLYFQRRGCQAVVLEVGLGGRLDSTNVCQPLVSVITSISFDHTQQLGNTPAEIAGEKAGIIKPGCPVISGVAVGPAADVIARVAAENGCRLFQLGREFTFRYQPPRHLEVDNNPPMFDYVDLTDGAIGDLHGLPMSLLGRHQAANSAVAVATICELRRTGWSISDGAIRQGISSVRWPARIELVGRRPPVVVDSAHNVASVEALVEVLAESFSARRRILIFGTSRDKDVRGMLEVLLASFDEVILTRYRNNPRGVSAEELLELAGEISGCSARAIPDPAAAWQAAVAAAEEEDLICVTGSFFTAAEIRPEIDRWLGQANPKRR